MRILVIGINYAPEEVGIGPYTAQMCEFLAARGHEVTVVAGKPYYPEWRDRGGPSGYRRSHENGVEVIRCPHYIPARPGGLKRIVHHLSFLASAVPAAWNAAGRLRPDLVLCVAPALLAAPAALLAARRNRSCRWLHIQDFELEAALATGLLAGPVAAGTGAWLERRLLNAFDRVSTISAPMMRKAADKGVPETRIAELRNWAELDAVTPGMATGFLRESLAIPAGPIALYSGNLAMKQGISVLAEAARLLEGRDPVQFVVCGDGSGRDEFARAIAGLGNIHLRPLQPREKLGELLSIADAHLLPQIPGAADLVLPSKLTNMLASGRPVIATAEPGTALFGEVEGCGISVPPGDAAALAEAVRSLLADPPLRAALGQAARARAEQRWSRDAILARLESQLVEAVASVSAGPGRGKVRELDESLSSGALRAEHAAHRRDSPHRSRSQ